MSASSSSIDVLEIDEDFDEHQTAYDELEGTSAIDISTSTPAQKLQALLRKGKGMFKMSLNKGDS